MLSAQELIEPKSASTFHTACGAAAMLRLRSMAATASRYAAKSPPEPDRAHFCGKPRGSTAGGVTVPIDADNDDAEANDDL